MTSGSRGMGYWSRLVNRLRTWTDAAGLGRPVRLFLLVAGLVLAAAVLTGILLGPRYALVPGLIGFGLCLVALFRGAIPSLSTWVERLGKPAALAAWAALVLAFAIVGFSSTAVIVIVLFIGGFVAGNVAWRLLGNALGMRERPPAMGNHSESAGIPHPNLFLVGIVGIAFLSVAASFLIGYYGLHERGPLGMALLFANAGLVLGIVPTVYRIVQRLKSTTRDREHPVGPRYLLREVFFTVLIVSLIGYEVSLVTNGRTLFAIPLLALIIVVSSYLVILARGFISLKERLRPYKPLLISALGMLLVFSPLIVILSNPPATLTRIYGGAQAAGLLVAMVYIGMTDPWREEARLLWTRLQTVARRKVGPWMPDIEVKKPKPPKAPPTKRRWWSLRRARRTEGSDEGGG